MSLISQAFSWKIRVGYKWLEEIEDTRWKEVRSTWTTACPYNWSPIFHSCLLVSHVTTVHSPVLVLKILNRPISHDLAPPFPPLHCMLVSPSPLTDPFLFLACASLSLFFGLCPWCTLFLECLFSTFFLALSYLPFRPWFNYYFLREAFWNQV